MLECLLPAAVDPAEAQGGGENGPAALSRLHCARDETSTIADPFNVVKNRQLGVAGENKVAVHAVDGEIVGNGAHGGRKTLGDGGAAIDAACAWRVPEGTGICEDILSAEARQRGSGLQRNKYVPGRCQ